MFNFGMFKGEKPKGELVKEVMNNKTEDEQVKDQAKIEGLAFQKALIEIMDELSEEQLEQLEAESISLGKEKFAESIREKYPHFNTRFTEIKQELVASLENSLEETDGIDTDTAGRVGELAFHATMNEIIAEADNEDIDALNSIMESDSSLEEKMKLIEEKMPNFKEVLNRKSEETSNDLNRLAQMTMEKVARIKKERGLE